MFDLGLISAGEEYEILIAQDGIAEETSHRLITEDKQLLLHQRRELLPHQGYLRWHRRNAFKGCLRPMPRIRKRGVFNLR